MIKKVLRADLLDERITDIVGQHIYFLHKPEEIKTELYIEYETISGYYDDFAGDLHMSRNYKIQVDIFSKGNYEKIQEIIEKVLEEKDYILVSIVDLYESDTSLFHCAFKFNKKILERKE